VTAIVWLAIVLLACLDLAFDDPESWIDPDADELPLADAPRRAD
jgi:hypothetical protein